MVHFHGFFPSANNGRDDNNNKGGPEPQVKEEQLERSKRCGGLNCAGRHSWIEIYILLVIVQGSTLGEE